MDALPGLVPGSGVAMDNNRPDPDTEVCVVSVIPAFTELHNLSEVPEHVA